MSVLAAKRRRSDLAGLGLILLGALLLLAAAAYYLLGSYSEAQLDDLVVSSAQAAYTPEQLRADIGAPPAALALESSAAQGSAQTPADASSPTIEVEPVSPSAGASSASDGAAPQGEAPAQASEDTPSSVPVQGALAAAQPGTDFDFGALKAEGGSASVGGASLAAQFSPVDWSTLPATIEALPPVKRIVIPAIDLDTKVVELSTKWEGERLVWETAFYAVGHHHGSPNPGEMGNAVFSGHISSPISREGAVFKRLPELARLIRPQQLGGEGRIIDVILYTSEARYLYRVTQTAVMAPAEVDVFRPTDIPSLTLVTCVPDGFYTHRLLVNAILVGVAPL